MRRGARAGGSEGDEGGEGGEGDVAFLAQAVARMGRTVGALLGASARAHDAVLRLAHGLRAHARETGALERQLAAAEREASALQRALLASTARRWPTAAAEVAAGGAGRAVGQRVARTPGHEDDASAFAPSPSNAPPSPTLASCSAHAFAQTSDSASVSALASDPSSVAGSTLITVCDRAVELVSGAASVTAAVSGPPSVLPSGTRSNYALTAASGPGCTRVSNRASVYAQDSASGPTCGSVAGRASALMFAPAPGSALVSAPTSAPSSASSAASGLALAVGSARPFASAPAPDSALASGPAAAYTLTSTACPPVLAGQAFGTAFASDLTSDPAYVCTRSCELDRSFVSAPTSARLSASGSSDVLLEPASGPESATPFVAAAASTVRAAADDGSAPLLSSAYNLHHVSTVASSVPDRCIAHPAATHGSAHPAPNAPTTAYPPSVAHVTDASAPAPTHSLKPGVSSVACGVAPARSVPACDVTAVPAAASGRARCPCGLRLCGCGDCGSLLPPPRSPSDSPSAGAAKPKTEGARRALGKQLLKAAHEGRAGDVRRLLDAGAPPNFTQGSLWTALHRAAWGGHAATVALLVARGGDVGARTAQGFTPLHVAAYNDPGGRCVHALLQGGADARAANACGWTALHYAAECGDAAAVHLLLAAGACPRARNQADKTPADLARAPPVRQLLQHAALRAGV